MKSLLLLAGFWCLFFVGQAGVFASAEDEIDQSLAASQAWLAQIDARQYDESYAFGCEAMHHKVSQDKWVLVLKTLRTPWGPVISRKQLSHVYKPNGFDGLDGECMVITYDTSFKRLDSATEVVVLKWEDGKWLGAGYNAGPKASANDESASQPAPSTTETHTQPHVKPEPQ